MSGARESIGPWKIAQLGTAARTAIVASRPARRHSVKGEQSREIIDFHFSMNRSFSLPPSSRRSAAPLLFHSLIPTTAAKLGFSFPPRRSSSSRTIQLLRLRIVHARTPVYLCARLAFAIQEPSSPAFSSPRCALGEGGSRAVVPIKFHPPLLSPLACGAGIAGNVTVPRGSWWISRGSTFPGRRSARVRCRRALIRPLAGISQPKGRRPH